MSCEETIAITVPIARMGQRSYLQAPLPEDTIRITGLEYDAAGKNGKPIIIRAPFLPVDPYLTLQANKVIGRLSLWVPGRENIFFQADIVEDRNPRYGEQLAALNWQPAAWNFGRKRDDFSISVESGVSFIEGYYQDSWGTGEFISLSYTLHLYLWIEKPCT